MIQDLGRHVLKTKAEIKKELSETKLTQGRSIIVFRKCLKAENCVTQNVSNSRFNR